MIRNYLGFPRGITGRQLGRRAVLQARVRRRVRPGPRPSPASSRAHLTACPRRRRRGRRPCRRPRLWGDVSASRRCRRSRRSSGTVCSTALRPRQARALQDADVVVVGAGNSGGQAALHLARTRPASRSAPADLAGGDDVGLPRPARSVRTRASPCAPTSTSSTAAATARLEWVELADRATGRARTRPAAGLFVLIGTETRTGWLPAEIQRDATGSCSPATTSIEHAGRAPARPIRSRPARRGSSPPATCAPATSSGSPPRSARDPSPSPWCTSTSNNFHAIGLPDDRTGHPRNPGTRRCQLRAGRLGRRAGQIWGSSAGRLCRRRTPPSSPMTAGSG